VFNLADVRTQAGEQLRAGMTDKGAAAGGAGISILL
jgi:hypothetical protein